MKRFISFIAALVLCSSLAIPVLAADMGQIKSAELSVKITENFQPDNALTISLVTASPAPGFADVPVAHNFYDAIMDCAVRGIVGGYGDGTFQPTKTVTRSNFTVMLSRAFYPDDVAKWTIPYYTNQGTFMPNYATMVMNNTLTNTSFQYAYDSTAEMNKGISRYDMAQLMTNIMEDKGFSASDAEKSAAVAQISDYSQIPTQYKDAVANVFALGMISGYADGSFGGTITMNRGQAAVVIYRMMQYIPTDSTPVDTAPEHSADPGTAGPEAPSASNSATLANGKAITEANVTELLAEIQAKYPHGTAFGNGYAGLNTGRNPNLNCIYQITRDYRISGTGQTINTTTGCGGWAACVADELFGQTNVTWKKTTLANIRPGDLMIQLDNNGQAKHVEICAGYVSGFDPTVKVRVASATGNPYKCFWVNAVTSNQNFDVYTAYPD